jgi:signal transduction histidine kinase
MSSANSQTETGKAGIAPAGARADVQQNLQRLDRLANLGLFSASIAHEIKNGLVAINTFCQLQAEKPDSGEMAEVACRELKRVDALVTQMLRLAAPKISALAPVNVHDLLDSTLSLLEYQMLERRVTLRRDYQAQPGLVRADESGLQQVLMNLLLNAVEAMGQGGELTAATAVRGGQLSISIQDTGAGIAPENLGRIFETFFTTKKNGTGLGLAISRRMVEEHQGKIEVESHGGQGSTFRILLPVA